MSFAVANEGFIEQRGTQDVVYHFLMAHNICTFYGEILGAQVNRILDHFREGKESIFSDHRQNVKVFDEIICITPS